MSVTINLVGPSTTPGAPQVSPAAINGAVNPALAQIQTFKATGAPTARSQMDRAADAANPLDHGAIGDGTSHPASGVFGTLAACQAVYPFATSLTQEMDYLAWQAVLNAGGPIVSRALHYIMCNANVASMTPLTVIAGQSWCDGNGAILDWSALVAQASSEHLVSNYNFADASDWTNATIYGPDGVSALTFASGSVSTTDTPVSFTQFGQQLNIPAGNYVVYLTLTATLGASYAEGNVNPPYGTLSFFQNSPGDGSNFTLITVPGLIGVITAGDAGITCVLSANWGTTEALNGWWLTFTAGGYADWEITTIDIVPYTPNCGIYCTRDGANEHYPIAQPMRGLELIGTGNDVVPTQAGTAQPSGIVYQSFVNGDGNLISWEDCSIHGWGSGIRLGDGAYLIEWRNCMIDSNAIGVYFPGGVNAGENNRFYGGGIYNSYYGFLNPGGSEFTLYGTALDYCYQPIAFNTSRIELHGCHVENHLNSVPLFQGGWIIMFGGMILGVAPTISPSDVVPPMSTANSGELFLCFGTQLYNLTSGNGTFMSGPGSFRAYGWINAGNPQIDVPSLTTVAMDPLAGYGNLEAPTNTPFFGTDPSGIYLEGGVWGPVGAVITDRWTADYLTVATSTAQYHSGTRSIEVTRASGASNNDYQILIMIPCLPGQDVALSFWWLAPTAVESPVALASLTCSGNVATGTTVDAHGITIGDFVPLVISGATQPAYNGTFVCKATTTTAFTYNLSGTAPSSPATGTPAYNGAADLYTRLFWAKKIGTDSNGRPILSPANVFKGEVDILLPLNGSATWTQWSGGSMYNPAVTTPATGNSPGAPIWATHLALVLDTESLPAMSFWLDDFVAYVI